MKKDEYALAVLLPSHLSSISRAPTSPPRAPLDRELLWSLHRLVQDLSATAKTSAPFLHAALASITRQSKLLAAAFDELVMCAVVGHLPQSVSLCLREVLLVLQRFKALATDCMAWSQMRLLLQLDEIEEEGRERPGHTARSLAGHQAGPRRGCREPAGARVALVLVVHTGGQDG